MIGERLWNLRKDADLTQDELAAILKVNKHSISAYERNKSEPPDDIKIAIAQYFDVSVDYLLGIIDTPVPIVRREKAIRLPIAFPDRLIPEVKDYIKYLAYKENNSNL